MGVSPKVRVFRSERHLETPGVPTGAFIRRSSLAAGEPHRHICDEVPTLSLSTNRYPIAQGSQWSINIVTQTCCLSYRVSSAGRTKVARISCLLVGLSDLTNGALYPRSWDHFFLNRGLMVGPPMSSGGEIPGPNRNSSSSGVKRPLFGGGFYRQEPVLPTPESSWPPTITSQPCPEW